jgi:tripartite-type tricarboxylate transporter receptor subunit TctC
MKRREFLKLSGGAAAAAFSITKASAQAATWPNKPVKLILPYAPGGATDLIGRPWADKLSQVFGQPFVIDNRGGAGGMIGTEAAAKATADGYTFLLTPNGPLTVLPGLRQLPYDPQKDFAPVGRVGDLVCGFVIHPVVGVKTFKEMVDYAKKNPGKLAFGSSGLGTAPHLRFELMKLATGIDILHVPYRGGADTLNDLLAGAIQMMNESSSIPHVKAGKLILLNINHHQRVRTFPDVPTLTELGYPGIDGGSWFGIYGLKSIPAEILERFNAKLVEIGKTPEMHARLEAVSAVLTPQTLPEVAQHLADDSQVTERIIRTANIRME